MCKGDLVCTDDRYRRGMCCDCSKHCVPLYSNLSSDERTNSIAIEKLENMVAVGDEREIMQFIKSRQNKKII